MDGQTARDHWRSADSLQMIEGGSESATDLVAEFALRLIAHVTEALPFASSTAEVYEFGPLIISLEVDGEEYRDRLTAAISFARRRSGASEKPAFRVLAIDGKASRLGSPPPWRFAVRHVRHLVRLHERPDLGLTARHDPETNTWQLVSAPQRLAIVWTSDAAAISYINDASPIRALLHWISVPAEGFLVHAASVGSPDRGVLLAGRNGAGKSTTVAAAVMSGMVTTGDDFVFVDPRSRSVHALYDSIKLDATALQLLNGFETTTVASRPLPGQKEIFSLTREHPASLRAQLPIAGVLLPRVAGASRTVFLPASPSEALRSLVPSTLFLLGGGEAQTTAKAARLLRGLPTFRCELSSDPLETSAAIRDFLPQLTA